MFTGPGSQLGSHPTQGFPPLSHSCTPHPWTTCPMTTCFFLKKKKLTVTSYIYLKRDVGSPRPTEDKGQAPTASEVTIQLTYKTIRVH